LIIDLSTVICYKCPECFDFHKEELNIFSAESSVIACDCKKTGISVMRKKDKYMIMIPCFACGEVHTFRLSKKQLFKSELFLFTCQMSGLDVGAAGKIENILKWETEYSAFLETVLFDDTEK